MPCPDDRTGGQRELHALDILACQRFAGTEPIFRLTSFGDVVEQDRDLELVRIADRDGAHVEPARKALGIAFEIGRLARPGDASIGLEPEPFEIGRVLRYPFAPQIGTRLTREGGVRFDETIVDRPIIGVELQLYDRERGIDGLQDGLETLLGLFERDAGDMLLGAVTQDFDEAQMHVAAIVKRHHLARRPEAFAGLAHMPALVRRAAVLQRSGHFVVDTPVRDVFGQEEPFGIVADHLIGSPAHHMLCAGVPVGDDPVRVGDDHREIGRTVEDRALPRRAGD